MALTHETGTRNAIANSVVDLIDVGSANSGGALVIGTAGMATTLVTIEFSSTAFGAASGGTATALSVPKEGTAVNTGTAAAFELVDKDRATVLTGTVSASGQGGDIELSSASITTNDVIRLSSLTYSAGA